MRTKVLLDVFEKLPQRAKELIFEHNDINILEDIGFYFEYCESPIELIMITSIEIYKKEKDKYIYYEPQYEININEKKYVADFVIYGDSLVNPGLSEDFKLIIECDGFYYHHCNKKQVEYDNKREYDLKMEGYNILRFTGSEIYNEPLECAKKIFNYIEKFKVNNNDR